MWLLMATLIGCGPDCSREKMWKGGLIPDACVEVDTVANVSVSKALSDSSFWVGCVKGTFQDDALVEGSSLLPLVKAFPDHLPVEAIEGYMKQPLAIPGVKNGAATRLCGRMVPAATPLGMAFSIDPKRPRF